MRGRKVPKAMFRAREEAVRMLPRRLAKLRGDLSQRAFARLLDVRQQYQQRYESGGQIPHTTYLMVLHDAGVSIDWLLSGKGRPLRDGRTSFEP